MTIFKIKIESINLFYLNQIFKNLNLFLFIFIRFLHHSLLSVIISVLPLSVSLWMTVIGLD